MGKEDFHLICYTRQIIVELTWADKGGLVSNVKGEGFRSGIDVKVMELAQCKR
jgi:hypothetical protein